jgi:hypothetical protein
MKLRGDFILRLKERQENNNVSKRRKLGTDSRKGKMLCIIVKHWYKILLMERDKLLKCCNEWQIGNPKMG